MYYINTQNPAKNLKQVVYPKITDEIASLKHFFQAINCLRENKSEGDGCQEADQLHKHTIKQTGKQMDIATYRRIRPRVQFSETNNFVGFIKLRSPYLLKTF